MRIYIKHIDLKKLICISIILLSILTTFLLVFDNNKPEYYTYLPLLPLAYCLTSLIFIKTYKNIIDNMGVSIIIILYFFRNVITPLIMMIGNYSGILSIRSEKSVIYAILIMIYETFFVFMYLNYKFSNYKVKIQKKFKVLMKKPVVYGFITVLLSLLIFITWFYVPEVRLNYSSILADNVATLNTNLTKDLLISNIPKRIMYTLFHFLFAFLRIFIPVCIIYIIRKKIKFNRMGVTISLIVVLLQLVFVSTETMFILIIMAALFLLVLRFYPEYKKLLIIFSSIGAILLLVAIIVAKSGNSSEFSAISASFQAYLPGVCNLAGIFNIQNNNIFSTLFFDIYSIIPFTSTLFKLFEGNNLGVLFNQCNNVNGQILPCIGQAFYYIGLLSPIIPILFISISLHFTNKMHVEKNVWKYITYVVIVIYSSITPIFYNFTLTGRIFTTVMIPMLILSSLSSNRFDIDALIANNNGE